MKMPEGQNRQLAHGMLSDPRKKGVPELVECDGEKARCVIGKDKHDGRNQKRRQSYVGARQRIGRPGKEIG